jgi:hypothetical protein
MLRRPVDAQVRPSSGSLNYWHTASRGGHRLPIRARLGLRVAVVAALAPSGVSQRPALEIQQL